MDSQATIDRLRTELAHRTQRGVAMPAVGMLYWLVVAGLGTQLPLRRALFFAFVATGAVFPLGLALSRAMGADLMARGHPLTGLGLTLNLVQLAYWPVVIAVYYAAPEWTAFTLALLFASHFLPYGWLYRSIGYPLIPAVALLACLGLAFAGAADLVHVAMAMAGAHLAGTLCILAENRLLRRTPVGSAVG